MPKNTAQRRIDSRRQNRATTISGVTLSGSPGSGGSAALAGDGLSYDGVALNVGAGTLLTVAADSVGITAGSTYQFIGTGSGTAAAWQNLSTLAGAGLTHTTGVLAVGAGNGITVSADAVALTTPGTLTVSTSNSASGSHTHAVTASADVTAGTSALLKSASGNLKLGTGNIGTTLGYNGTFTSGFAGAGWQVDYGVTEAAKASATFDNLTIRGQMRVYELLIQQIRATNGSVLVSSSSKALTVTASDDPLWTVNGVQLTFNGANATLETTLYAITTSTSTEAGADRTHYHGFLVGDLIRAQQMEWDGSGFAGVFQSDLEVTSVSNLYTYQGARVSTASDAPAVGYDFVRLGSASDTTRQGVVYLTSDDDNAPFIDIVDGVAAHSQWNTAGKIRARLGKLSGITDAEFGTLDGYGLWSDNVYLTGSIYATDGIFNGTVYATDGIFSGTVYASAGTFTGAITAQSGSIDGFLTIGTSGGIYQGTGTAGTPTNGVKLFNDNGIGQIASYDGGTKTFRIGDDDVRYLITADFDDIRTVKWLDDIDFTGTWSDLASEPGQYAFMGAYKTSSYSYLYLSSRVNDTGSPSNPRGSSIVLSASHNHSGTTTSGSLSVTTLNSTYSYQTVVSTFGAFLQIGDISATPLLGLSASSDAHIYIKGGNLVVRYNDGGTYRYKYLTLSGTGTTWTHTTTAP